MSKATGALLVSFILLATPAVGAPTPPSDPIAPFETIEGYAVPKLLEALHERADFDECEGATKLIVLYLGQMARIAIMVDARVCAIVTGPADGVRELLAAFKGHAI